MKWKEGRRGADGKFGDIVKGGKLFLKWDLNRTKNGDLNNIELLRNSRVIETWKPDNGNEFFSVKFADEHYLKEAGVLKRRTENGVGANLVFAQ